MDRHLQLVPTVPDQHQPSDENICSERQRTKANPQNSAKENDEHASYRRVSRPRFRQARLGRPRVRRWRVRRTVRGEWQNGNRSMPYRLWIWQRRYERDRARRLGLPLSTHTLEDSQAACTMESVPPRRRAVACRWHGPVLLR